MNASGVKSGLCVHLGVGDGDLTAPLGQAGFLVQGLTADPAAVQGARAQIQARGVYGKVSVRHANFRTLPYADNLVNLVVAESVPAGLDLKEITRILAPNGVVCLGGKVDAAGLTAGGLRDARTAGSWTVAIKPRPSEMDDWACYDHAPDGNPVSRDRVAAAPNRLRWRDDCEGDEFRGSLITVGGRMFYRTPAPNYGHTPTRLNLIARDAYNGLLLWKRPVEMMGSHINGLSFRDLVASADRVFVPLENSGILAALDAATGKLVRKYPEAGRVTSVLHHEGKLYTSNMALDVETGGVLWKKAELDIKAIAGGRAFALEGSPRRTGRLPQLTCLDLRTGAIQGQTQLSHPVSVFLSCVDGKVRCFGR